MKEGYEKAINSLSERLQQLEQAPPPPAAAAPAARARGGSVAPGARAGPASGRMPSLMDLARPRQPFALYERRGAGQLLFDMGVAGDFVGNLTQHNVRARPRAAPSPGWRTASSRARSSCPSSARSTPTRAPRCASRRARRTRAEIALHLAEANLTLMALPFGTQLKIGPDAQPLRPPEPDPRARPALHRHPQRAASVLRRRRGSSRAAAS